MKNLFAALRAELCAGRSAVLCSIVASSGSTPRGAGAKMLVREDGGTLGTVGGGAVEYQAAQAARELFLTRRSRIQAYRLSPGDIADIGMICGGDVRIYLQLFDPADAASLSLTEEILRRLDGRSPAWLVTAVSGGRWQAEVCGAEDEAPWGLSQEELASLMGAKPALRDGDPLLYVEPLRRAGTVYLFGAGHVGLALLHLLTLTEFRVVVYDQRPEAAGSPPVPEAAAVVRGPYIHALERLDPITAEDYVVIMTPGHQGDYEVLSQVLSTPARYIGCIGSRKKVAVTRERLLSDGFSPAEIDRIYAPIGLPIGGETPAEIAVSVAAQLIACRSGKLEKKGTAL